MKSFVLIVSCAMLLICSATICRSEQTDFQLAMKAYTEGDYKAANAMFEKIPPSDDASYRLALFLRASIASATGDKNEALALYRESFANPPKSNIAELAVSFGKFADSNNLYEDCVKLYTSLPGFSEYVLTSKDMIAWYYAKSLLKTGQIRRGLSVLGEMWDAFSENKNADSCDLLSMAVSEKDALYKDFKLTALQQNSARTLAAKMRVSIIASKPLPEITQDDISQLSLGELYYLALERKADWVVPFLEQRAIAQPDSVFAWRAMYVAAHSLYEKKDYEGALNLLAQAESMAPDDMSEIFRIILLKGDCLRLMRQYAAARAEYLKVVMSKQVKGLPSAEAIYKTGMTWYSEGKYENAHAYFERVYVAFFPFDYWASRAYLYDAKSLIYIAKPNMAHKVLREYIKTTKNPSGPIYEEALKLYWQKD